MFFRFKTLAIFVSLLVCVTAFGMTELIEGSGPEAGTNASGEVVLTPAPGNQNVPAPPTPTPPVITKTPGPVTLGDHNYYNQYSIGGQYGSQYCRNVSITDVPDMTGAPLGNQTIYELGDRLLQGPGHDKNDVQLFVPDGSEMEWRCFMYGVETGETPYAKFTSCAGGGGPATPNPAGTITPVSQGGNVWRATCTGFRDACWNQSVTCPAGGNVTQVKAMVNGEYQYYFNPAVINLLANRPWGTLDVRQTCALRNDYASGTQCIQVNNAGCPTSNVANTCATSIAVTDPKLIRFGCRDDDTSCSGSTCGCTISVDFACSPGSPPTSGGGGPPAQDLGINCRAMTGI